MPEAQLDRFMLKLHVDYPSREEEDQIILRMAKSGGEKPTVKAVAQPEQILAARKLLDSVYLDDLARSYILDLVFATRNPEDFGLPDLQPMILYGASPRASLALAQTARAHAFLEGRAFVTPNDIKSMGMEVLRHRVIRTYEAEAESISSEHVIQRIFDTVPVP